MTEQLVRDLAIEQDIQTKIKDTLAHKNQSYEQYCDLLDCEKKCKLKLTITYDMVGNNRSFGRRYDSSSRHALIICGISKGVVGMFIYPMDFQKCDAVDKRGEK